MNNLAEIQEAALSRWAESNEWAAIRGIDEPTWNALSTTIYPGAKPESVLMAVDYCRARGLDPMLKPVHLVPVQVKDAQSGNKEWRDVPMPGVGLYRIQADRSGTYAGADEPEFGPTIEQEFQGTDYNKKPITVTVRYPEWCKYTVHKLIDGRLVAFTAKEFWLENYATQSNSSEAPNAMWKKRPFAQLAKCAEAQALRKAWPEIGQEPTAEEMEGKDYIRDVTPAKEVTALPGRADPETYPDEKFKANLPAWRDLVESGKRTPEEIINMVGSRATLTDQQKQIISNLGGAK